MGEDAAATRSSRTQRLGLMLGALVFAVLALAFDPVPEQPAVGRMAAVAALMAIWWITEAIPIPATSLLPLVLFPLLGLMPTKQAAGYYMNSTIFLFLGGFLIALAVERTGLHRRIALRIVHLVGHDPRHLVLGFMLATAALSMWISNTATAMMMLPIGLSLVAEARRGSESSGVAGPRVGSFAVALMLAIAYGANIGGMATLIGTPPNLALHRIYAQSFPEAPPISFYSWFTLGLPLVLLLLLAAWTLLVRVLCPLPQRGLLEGGQFVQQELRRLGRLRRDEALVLAVFVATALLWMTRSDIDLGSITLPGWTSLLGLAALVDDATVAVAMATLLFLLPSRDPGHRRILEWEITRRLPWGILLLFGGGFALAGGLASSGLTDWVGSRFAGLQGTSPHVLVMAVSTLITFLTELTSNTATTELVLPILAGVSKAMAVHPLILMLPATLSASCAFMLPVATPPNAIVYSSGLVSMRKMATAGLVMNLLGVAVISVAVWLLAGPCLGVDW